jgi:hypothetical protein
MGRQNKPEYSQDQLERIETCGQCQMNVFETALLCGVTEAELTDGELCKIYMRGRLEAELAVRRALVQKAQDGDCAAQREFMKLAEESRPNISG